MLELLARAILPRLRLREALPHWRSIGHRLAEPPRRRRLQSLRLMDILC
jgi:hypothetical protein